MIENNLHKFELDPQFKKVYESLKAQIRNLEAILKDPDMVIYEEIAELKRQVDLDREQLKSQIDEIANDTIQKLESYEAKFKAEYKAKIDLKHYNQLLESSAKQLSEYETCLNLFSTMHNERKEKSKESEEITKNLKPKIIELKDLLFSNLILRYNPMQNNIKNLFGKLIIKVI